MLVWKLMQVDFTLDNALTNTFQFAAVILKDPIEQW